MPVFSIYVWDQVGRTLYIEEHDTLLDAVAEAGRNRLWTEIRVYEHRGRQKVLVYRKVHETAESCVAGGKYDGLSARKIAEKCRLPLTTVKELLNELDGGG